MNNLFGIRSILVDVRENAQNDDKKTHRFVDKLNSPPRNSFATGTNYARWSKGS
jgi:hypothetical protein